MERGYNREKYKQLYDMVKLYGTLSTNAATSLVVMTHAALEAINRLFISFAVNDVVPGLIIAPYKSKQMVKGQICQVGIKEFS